MSVISLNLSLKAFYRAQKAREVSAAATPAIIRVEALSTTVQEAAAETPTTAVEVDVCLYE